MLWNSCFLDKNIWHFHLICFLTFTNSSIRRELNWDGIDGNFRSKTTPEGERKEWKGEKTNQFHFFKLAFCFFFRFFFGLMPSFFGNFFCFWVNEFCVCLWSFERGGEFLYVLERFKSLKITAGKNLKYEIYWMLIFYLLGDFLLEIKFFYLNLIIYQFLS